MKSIKYLSLVVLLCLISCKDNSNDKTLTAKHPAVLPSLEWVKIPENYSPLTATGITDLIKDVKVRNIEQYANKSEFETTVAYETRISKSPMPDQLYWLWIDRPSIYKKSDDGNYEQDCNNSVAISYDADRQQFDVSFKTFFENGEKVIRVDCRESYLDGKLSFVWKTLVEADDLKESDIERIRVSVPMSVDQAKESIKPFSILLIAKPDQRKGNNIARKYTNNGVPIIETNSIAMRVSDAWIINWQTRDVLKKINFVDGR